MKQILVALAIAITLAAGWPTEATAACCRGRPRIAARLVGRLVHPFRRVARAEYRPSSYGNTCTGGACASCR